jgi:Txe/YoeB family toxin of Txe-Axe toxin-antitoxin module
LERIGKLAKKYYPRVVNQIKDVRRDAYQGLGKSLALKCELHGYWLR